MHKLLDRIDIVDSDSGRVRPPGSQAHLRGFEQSTTISQRESNWRSFGISGSTMPEGVPSSMRESLACSLARIGNGLRSNEQAIRSRRCQTHVIDTQTTGYWQRQRAPFRASEEPKRSFDQTVVVRRSGRAIVDSNSIRRHPLVADRADVVSENEQ
jgi:hypothetical protein